MSNVPYYNHSDMKYRLRLLQIRGKLYPLCIIVNEVDLPRMHWRKQPVLVIFLSVGPSFLPFPDSPFVCTSILVRHQRYQSFDVACKSVLTFLLCVQFFSLFPSIAKPLTRRSNVSSQSFIFVCQIQQSTLTHSSFTHMKIWYVCKDEENEILFAPCCLHSCTVFVHVKNSLFLTNIIELSMF